MASRLVLFLHGWSVTSTSAYGRLPERLVAEGRRTGQTIRTRDVFLGKYISFRDEVRLRDIAEAFDRALRSKPVASALRTHGSFSCVTHSTGAIVVREWLRMHFGDDVSSSPLRHLIMLAPPNFGSALAQLGASRLGRIRAFFEGVEPGTGVLDWLELGSPESWALNTDWIRSRTRPVGDDGPWLVVLSGQTIDRRYYDILNSYTGETGSDGVVRVAAANLNATYVRLEQRERTARERSKTPGSLVVAESSTSSPAAMLVVPGASHVGTRRGIMRCVRAEPGGELRAARRTLALDVLEALGVDQPTSHPIDRERTTIEAMLATLRVSTASAYDDLTARFTRATEIVQRAEHVELEDRFVLNDTVYVHDPHSMVIVRVQDDAGYIVDDFDLLFTGDGHDENHLPRGFFTDRQRNRRHAGTVTYYLNHRVMTGADAVMDPRSGDRLLRVDRPGLSVLGVKLRPRPDEGFVYYNACECEATSTVLRTVLKANQTTLLDIVIRRHLRDSVLTFDRLGRGRRSFKRS